MNANSGARIRARSRAESRLRAMTIGTAVLGVAATGAFGWAAAITYDGKTSTALAADPGTGGDSNAAGNPGAGFSDPNAGVTNPNPGVTNPNGGVTNPNPVSGNQGTVPTVRHSKNRSGHASSGGS